MVFQDQTAAATGPVPNLTMNTSSGQIVNRSQPPVTRKTTIPAPVVPNQPQSDSSKLMEIIFRYRSVTELFDTRSKHDEKFSIGFKICNLYKKEKLVINFLEVV